MDAIARLNIPDETTHVIKSFYKSPEFGIADREGKSEYRRQRAGIRKGYPLSPYLFVLLMMIISTIFTG